ncbi:hypothetical protein SNEBB_000850, partial [Seison nebaliae]
IVVFIAIGVTIAVSVGSSSSSNNDSNNAETVSTTTTKKFEGNETMSTNNLINSTAEDKVTVLELTSEVKFPCKESYMITRGGIYVTPCDHA